MTYESPTPLLIKVQGERFWTYSQDPFTLTKHEEELLSIIREKDGLPGLAPEDPDGLYYFNTWVLDEETEVVNTIPVPKEAVAGAEEHIRRVNSAIGEDLVEQHTSRRRAADRPWQWFEVTGVAVIFALLAADKYKRKG